MKVKFDVDYDGYPYALCSDGVEVEVSEEWLEGYKKNLHRFNAYQSQIGDMIAIAKVEMKRKQKIDEVYQP